MTTNDGSDSSAMDWEIFFESFNYLGTSKMIAGLLVSQPLALIAPNDNTLVLGRESFGLSECLYDKEFTRITNVDSSREVIRYMLGRHLRSRPLMRSLVREINNLKLPYSRELFNVVVDKGGLDQALGESEDSKTACLARSRLHEVIRVLAPDGKYILVTLAQHGLLELVMKTFRAGWHVSVKAIQVLHSSASTLQPFMVVMLKTNAQKETRIKLSLVSLDITWHGASNMLQVEEVMKAVDSENFLRSKEHSHKRYHNSKINPGDPLDYKTLHPGRRVPFKLGKHGSKFSCCGVILDLPEAIITRPLCAIGFHINPGLEHEWHKFTVNSEEEQWQSAEYLGAARVILVWLLSERYDNNLKEVKDYLLPLLKDFFPLGCTESSVNFSDIEGPFSKQVERDEVLSSFAETILIEDVLEWEVNGDTLWKTWYRQLLFKRSPHLIQSKACLIQRNTTTRSDTEATTSKANTLKIVNRKNINRGKRDAAGSDHGAISLLEDFFIAEILEVDHCNLFDVYHRCIIQALVVVVNNLEQWIATTRKVRFLFVGLGAGLLPTFVHNHLQFAEIEVVELDPAVGKLAKKHFGFTEDERMKLVIGDGLRHIQAIASSVNTSSVPSSGSRDDIQGVTSRSSPTETMVSAQLSGMRMSAPKSNRKGKDKTPESGGRVHVIIVDVDSKDSRGDLNAPAKEFMEDEFVLAARDGLLKGGVLIIHVQGILLTYDAALDVKLKKVYAIDVGEEKGRIVIGLPQKKTTSTTSIINDEIVKLQKLIEPCESCRTVQDFRDNLHRLRRIH